MGLEQIAQGHLFAPGAATRLRSVGGVVAIVV